MVDVLSEQRDHGVAVVTLNRPDRRNALSAALLSALRARVAELDASEDVRAIVLTGADPAFCAGVDLKQAKAVVEYASWATEPATPGGDTTVRSW